MFNPVFKGESVQIDAKTCTCTCWCSCTCDQLMPTYSTWYGSGNGGASQPGTWFASWS